MRILLALVVAIGAVVASYYLLGLDVRVVLVAKSELKTSATLDYSYNDPPQRFQFVPAGSRLSVRKCVDTKSDLVPLVIMPDGESNYVAYGDYKMEAVPRTVVDFSMGYGIGCGPFLR